eukprot:GHVS01106836.1.p1 GENE.GHVS01106836.1~~GHVS01106836.1.p1  ORF type:complete len:703 (+),score=45.43 GHVS01106836.1:22-2109(+)
MTPSSLLLSYDTWLFVLVFVVAVKLEPIICPLWKTLVRRVHLILPLDQEDERNFASASSKTKSNKVGGTPTLRMLNLDKIIDHNCFCRELRSSHPLAAVVSTGASSSPLEHQEQLLGGSSLLLASLLYIFVLVVKWSCCCMYFAGKSCGAEDEHRTFGGDDGVAIVPVVVLACLAFFILVTMTRINVGNAKYRVAKFSAQCSKITTLCTILSVTFVFYGSSPNAAHIRGEPLIDTDLGVGLDLLTARLDNLFGPLGYDSAPVVRWIRVAIQLFLCGTILWFALSSYVAIQHEANTRCLFRYRTKYIQASLNNYPESCARSSWERFFSATLPFVVSALWLPFLFRPLMLWGKVTTCCLQAFRMVLGFIMCFLMYRQIPLTIQLSTIQQSQQITHLRRGSNLTAGVCQRLNSLVSYVFRGACTRVVEQAGVPTFFMALLLINATTGVWAGCFRNSCPTTISTVPANLAYPRLGTSSPYRSAEDRYLRLFTDPIIPSAVSRELRASVIGGSAECCCNGTMEEDSIDETSFGFRSCRPISLKQALFCPCLPLHVTAVPSPKCRAESPGSHVPHNGDFSRLEVGTSAERTPLPHEEQSPLQQLAAWMVGRTPLEIPSTDPFRATHKWTREFTEELRSLVPLELIGSMSDTVLCLGYILYSFIWIIAALETRVSHLSCVGASAYGPSQTPCPLPQASRDHT